MLPSKFSGALATFLDEEGACAMPVWFVARVVLLARSVMAWNALLTQPVRFPNAWRTWAAVNCYSLAIGEGGCGGRGGGTQGGGDVGCE